MKVTADNAEASLSPNSIPRSDVLAANLTKLGVRRGDRVVLFMPVVPEAAVAFLACAMLGAISVPAFTGYGAEALATRLRDSEAVALITADGTTRRGKRIPMKSTADEALESAPAVKNVIVVRHLGDGASMQDGRDVYWDELDRDPAPVETADTESNDPLTIIYTSGTTGAPKGIVHSHAGFLVKAAHGLRLRFRHPRGRRDRLDRRHGLDARSADDHGRAAARARRS